jgi:hypothetical protein
LRAAASSSSSASRATASRSCSWVSGTTVAPRAEALGVGWRSLHAPLASLLAQIVGAGGGASAATGELRAGPLPLKYKCGLLTPRCDRLSRRFRDSSSHSACSGRASISREHTARI